MKTLEEALSAYKRGQVNELFLANLNNLWQELEACPDFMEMIDIALADLTGRISIPEEDRPVVLASLCALFQAGVTIGIDMERAEIAEAEAKE